MTEVTNTANVSLHAKYRYATRILNMNFKDEGVYRSWQKKNETEDADIKEKVLQAFSNCELVYTGKLTDSEDICNYYVDLENLITFVANTNSNIITCYKIFFDMSEEIDKKVAKEILKEIRKLQKTREKFYMIVQKQVEEIDFNINTNDIEIQRVETILKNLKDRKINLEEQRRLKKKDIEGIDYDIHKLSTKLCYSCQLKNDWRVV